MSPSRRNAAAVTLLFGLVLGSLGFFRAASADDPCVKWPDACAGNAGGDPSNGGNGGGGSGGPQPTSPPGSRPGSPGEDPTANGGTGGVGNSGTPGANNTPTPIPTAPPAGLDSMGSSSSAATGGTSASKGSSAAAAAAAAADPTLVAWAKRFNTTPDEVMSWFGTYTPEDSIGGEAPLVDVHADDTLTISDHEITRASGDSNMNLLDPAKRDNGVATADGQRVDIAMHSTAIVLGSATSDASGRFSATVSVPNSLSAGKHFIIALAPKPNGGRAAFVFPLTIAEGAAAAPAAAGPSRPAKRFPWLLFEAVLGTVLVVGLFVVRVNAAVHR